MEELVKAVNKRTEVSISVFCEINPMVSATQAGFDVTKTVLIQLNSSNFLGLRLPAMMAACIGYP
jgi:hypothetical protein